MLRFWSMLCSVAIHMRKSPFYLTVLLLALGLTFLQGCEAPKRDIFILDSTKVLEPASELRDVITWSVVAVGPVADSLNKESLEIIQGLLQEGLIQKQFSAIALDRVRGLSEQYGSTEAGALRAVAALKADAVLILSLGEWDESGLYTLGKVRAKGEIKLVDSKQKIRWGGNLKVDSVLIPSTAKNASLEEKRLLAVQNFARQLARRLPSQF